MKKILLPTWLLAVLASGCSQDELVNDNQMDLNQDRIYTTSFEDCNSRTYVNDEGKLRWTADDRISIFECNTYNREFKFDGITGANSGEFSAVGDAYSTGNSLTARYAVYPYNANTTISDDGVMSVTFPAVQNYAVNSFGLGANTMVAVTEDAEGTFLGFKNACGYLKLMLYGTNVTVQSITLKGNASEPIAGAATVTATYGEEPSVAMASTGTSSTITLDCGTNGVTLGSTASEATAFWIAVPPTTFTNGFTITVTNTHGTTFTKSTTNAFEIERNVIKPMATIEAEGLSVYHVATAGTLSQLIGDDLKNTLTSLVVTGELNGTDIKFIREMAGSDAKGQATEGVLASLDLSKATIVAGGEAYYSTTSTYSTENNMIGTNMFCSCSKLVKIKLPDNIEGIGEQAFFNCTKLKIVNIPSTVKSLGKRAFSGTAISTITIPESITTLPNQLFSTCESLSSITIPNTVTEIGSSAFSGCI